MPAPTRAALRHLRSLTLAAVSAALLAGCATKPTWQPYPTKDRTFVANEGDQRGQYMAPVAFETEAGERIDLQDLRGNVVLVHYWASWCPECRRELQSLQKLKNTLAQRRGLEFVVLNGLEDFEAGRSWARANGITMPLYRRLDRAVPGSAQAASTSPAEVPRTYVVSRDGIVVARYDRPRQWEAFDTSLEMLLDHREYRLPPVTDARTVIRAPSTTIKAVIRPLAAQEGLHELTVDVVPHTGVRLASDVGITVAPGTPKGLVWRSDVPVRLTESGRYMSGALSVPFEFNAIGLSSLDIDVSYAVCDPDGACHRESKQVTVSP